MAYFDPKEAEREISKTNNIHVQRNLEYEAEKHGYSTSYRGRHARLEKDYGRSNDERDSRNTSSGVSGESNSSSSYDNKGNYNDEVNDNTESDGGAALAKFSFQLMVVCIVALLPLTLIHYEFYGTIPQVSLSDEHLFVLVGFVFLFLRSSFGRLMIACLGMFGAFAYYVYLDIPIWTEPITMLFVLIPILISFTNWNHSLKSLSFVLLPAVPILLFQSEHYGLWAAMTISGFLLLLRKSKRKRASRA